MFTVSGCGCGCLRNDKGELGLRLKEIWDEVCEVCEARSVEELKDELSDVMFGFGRLARIYVRMWFDERHIAKIEKRFKETGCVRSRRHLVNDMCPSVAAEK
jgi:NTP pyrophosphatase (non-canonical NTP hydrolase)